MPETEYRNLLKVRAITCQKVLQRRWEKLMLKRVWFSITSWETQRWNILNITPGTVSRRDATFSPCQNGPQAGLSRRGETICYVGSRPWGCCQGPQAHFYYSCPLLKYKSPRVQISCLEKKERRVEPRIDNILTCTDLKNSYSGLDSLPAFRQAVQCKVRSNEL